MAMIKKFKLASGGTQIIIRPFGYSLFILCYSNLWGWVRILGRGIKWKHEKIGLLFSERNGYRKYIKLFGWIFSTL